MTPFPRIYGLVVRPMRWRCTEKLQMQSKHPATMSDAIIINVVLIKSHVRTAEAATGLHDCLIACLPEALHQSSPRMICWPLKVVTGGYDRTFNWRFDINIPGKRVKARLERLVGAIGTSAERRCNIAADLTNPPEESSSFALIFAALRSAFDYPSGIIWCSCAKCRTLENGPHLRRFCETPAVF